MARYDNIYGAGNVTVNAPPDFWTAAKQSFDEDYDRLVEADQREDIKEQQALENNRAERQLIMQEEQAATQQEAADRQKFTNELSMFTDPNQKAMWAKRTGVSKGWVSREQVQEWEEQGVANQSYESLRKSFLSGDAETRSLIGGRLREKALAANAPPAEIKLWDEWDKEANEELGMKQALEFAFSGMSKEIQESMRSIIGTGSINEKTIDLIEAKLKQSTEYASDVYKGKIDLLKNVRTGISKMGIDIPEKTRNYFQLMDLQLTADLARTGRVEEEDVETKYKNLSLEEFDPYLTGKDKSYDVNVADERKGKIFNTVIKAYQKEWDAADESGRRVIGKKIIDEINATSYEPATKAAGFGGIEYEDPEYVGKEIEFSEEDIAKKIKSIMDRKRVPENQRKKKNVINQMREEAKKELQRERTKESKKRAAEIARKTVGTYPQGWMSR